MSADFKLIGETLLFFLPAISSLTCGVLLLCINRNKLLKKENKIRQLMILYFTLIVGHWIFVAIFKPLGVVGGYILPFSAIVLRMQHVIFFNFVWILTPLRVNEPKMPAYHYIIPGILCMVELFFYFRLFHIDESFTVPEDMGIYLALSNLLYSICYISLSFYRLSIYKKIVKKDRHTNRLDWLAAVLIIKVISIGYGTFFYRPDGSLPYYIMLVPLQHLIIIYNVLKRNYSFATLYQQQTLLAPSGRVITVQKNTSEEKTEDRAEKPESIKISHLFNQEYFEDYFGREKPFLNPELKLDDLAKELATNRSYVSKFINETYKMNFKQYINQWRLQEIERLLEAGECKGKSLEEIVGKAGFGSLRSYQRIIKTMEKNK